MYCQQSYRLLLEKPFNTISLYPIGYLILRLRSWHTEDWTTSDDRVRGGNSQVGCRSLPFSASTDRFVSCRSSRCHVFGPSEIIQL